VQESGFISAREDVAVRRKYADEAIRRAYESTSSDKEAGKALGCTPGVFWFLRNWAGLPAKGKKGGGKACWKRKYIDAAILAAYQSTVNDREAGAKLGVAGNYFGYLRKRTGLAAKGKRAGKVTEAAFRENYETAGNDKELGKMLGVTAGYACVLRARYALPAKGRHWRKHVIITGMPAGELARGDVRVRPERPPIGVKLRDIANRFREEQERLGRKMLAEVDEALSEALIKEALR
jgi:hypothetical protein